MNFVNNIKRSNIYMDKPEHIIEHNEFSSYIKKKVTQFGDKNYGRRPTKQNNSGNQCVIIPSDDRIQVEDYSESPYCSIGLIQSRYDKTTGFGTGFLIQSNLVLTCAHNCYHHPDEEIAKAFEYEELKFIIGEKQNRKEYLVKRWAFPTQYKVKGEGEDKNQHEKYDYALLELHQNIGQIYGFFGLKFFNTQKQQAIIEKSLCHIVGFPSQKTKGDIKNMFVANSRNEDYTITYNYIIHDISTTPGESGSPLFVENDKQYFVIGIHVQGSNNSFKKGSNLAITLNKEVQDFLSVARDKHGITISFEDKQLNDEKLKSFLIANSKQIQAEEIQFDASNNKLANLPEEIWNLKNITQLNLSQNSLISISEDIQNLKALSYLNISKNNIMKLPESLSFLKQLYTLDISENPIEIFPGKAISSLTGLGNLYIRHLNLEEFPQQINQLNYLRNLYISFNKLSQLKIPKSSKDLKQLCFVDATSNPIQEIDNIYNLRRGCVIQLDKQQAIQQYINENNLQTDYGIIVNFQ